MSRRGRALAFVLAALLAAAAAAAIADGYGASVARGYGELRPVVVAADRPARPGRRSTRAGRRRARAAAGPGPVRAARGARRPGRGDRPGSARRRSRPAPTCSPRSCGRRGPARRRSLGLGGGRRPVEIAVSGAEALLVGGAQPVGARVDVVVTTEPSGAGTGRTYVAAAGGAAAGPGAGAGRRRRRGSPPRRSALTRRQALRLIAAESFARQVTLLPRG